MLKGHVDIAGLSYPEVLMALFKGANPVDGEVKTPLTQEEARRALNNKMHIGELNGAFIGVTFSGQVLDVQLYDGYNGEGTAQAVIDDLRRETNAKTLMAGIMREPTLKLVRGPEAVRERLMGSGSPMFLGFPR